MKKQGLVWMLGLWAAVAQAGDGLEAKDGWVRLVPPVSANSAAYFTLHNPSVRAVAIVAAESAVAQTVELHDVVHENGMMRMQKQDQVQIPAHASLAFQPGGQHVMLIGLKQPLQAGQAVSLTLRLADGAQLTVPLVVKADEGTADHGGHQHHAGH